METSVPPTVRRPYGFYANRMVTSLLLACCKVIACLAFFKFGIELISETAMPQPHRKATIRRPYSGLAMAVRWHTVFTLSWVPRKSYDRLMTPLRQTCCSCNNREGAVQSPPGFLAVTLWFLISWIVWSPCCCRKICDHNYCSPQGLTIFKNHISQTVGPRTSNQKLKVALSGVWIAFLLLRSLVTFM